MRTYSIASRRDVVKDPRATDFEAFYDSWYSRAVNIARRKGLPDPEAAAQECMLVFLQNDYLDMHDPSMGASFDTWVGRILYLRIVSMQRQELRRRTIAPMQPLLGNEEVRDEARGYLDFKQRMLDATALIKERYPEWFPLWKNLVVQVLSGNATLGDTIDQREFASRSGMTQRQLEEALDEFIAVVASDWDLADLLDVDRSLVST